MMMGGLILHRNDFHENDYIYINNQDKTFTETIQSRLSHMSHFTMGVDMLI